MSPQLRTEAGRPLLDRYGELIELSASGQVGMRHLFNEHLARVEWDEWKFPVLTTEVIMEAVLYARAA